MQTPPDKAALKRPISPTTVLESSTTNTAQPRSASNEQNQSSSPEMAAPPSRVSKEQFTHGAFVILLPLIQRCPGHWFRQPQILQHNPQAAGFHDLQYLETCFDAVLQFNRLAATQGYRLEDFSDAYHELRERDDRFREPWDAPWTNPFAASLALKEWIDTTTYYIKMMKDVDIPKKAAWLGDPWAELGPEGRASYNAYLEKYDSKQPGGKGRTGEWKPPMRGDLSDEQAAAWGQATMDDMEERLGLTKEHKLGVKKVEKKPYGSYNRHPFFRPVREDDEEEGKKKRSSWIPSPFLKKTFDENAAEEDDDDLLDTPVPPASPSLRKIFSNLGLGKDGEEQEDDQEGQRTSSIFRRSSQLLRMPSMRNSLKRISGGGSPSTPHSPGPGTPRLSGSGRPAT